MMRKVFQLEIQGFDPHIICVKLGFLSHGHRLESANL